VTADIATILGSPSVREADPPAVRCGAMPEDSLAGSGGAAGSEDRANQRLRREIDRLNWEAGNLNAQIGRVTATVRSMEMSSSWRLTRPLRWLGSRTRSPRG
jgi:hypothetical protein